MGKIEEIRKAMHPVSDLFYRETITIFGDDKSFLVITNPKDATPWQFVFHSSDNEAINVFFIIKPMTIFSGENVFQMLGIPCNFQSGDALIGIKKISNHIQTHSNQIFYAFSDKRIKKTMQQLQKIPCNNEEEIKVIYELLHP